MSEYDYLDRDGLESVRWGETDGDELWAPPRTTALSRMRQGATHLGISAAEYLEHRASGEHWCGYHRAWEPVERFGTHLKRGKPYPNGRCREGDVAAQRERRAAAETESDR